MNRPLLGNLYSHSRKKNERRRKLNLSRKTMMSFRFLP
ncbi:MAG: hypothetical protein HN982_03865 [Candidatus Marinimicrobia bacterium]|nr:hypothetical protein [Candidatus Woesearchaeota archaeon]MBT6936704.1 hypothetical protein [Candidatus Neomarinimicrobiota bacterium]